MDNRVPRARQNHGENESIDVKNVILYFGKLKLGKDGNLEASQATPQEEDAAANASNSKEIKNQCHVVEDSVLDHGSSWGHNVFAAQGQEFAQESFCGLQDYTDNHIDMCELDVFGGASSSKQPTIYDYSSTSNNPVLGFWPASLTNNVAYSGIDCGSTSISSGSIRIKSCADGRPSFDLKLLHEILVGGDRAEISMLLLTLQGSYFDLMRDKSLCHVFQKLVDSCRGHQLDVVVTDVISCTQFLINTAFCKPGASSIIRLIKRVKKSSHAFSIVQILSTHFLAIMTHDTARWVIQNCLIHFPSQHNKALYEQAILHCQELATDKVGSRSLNDFINTICGEQRSRLLKDIADCSAHLSNHEYGNYVVQNVLSLKNDSISAAIVSGLRGQFVELAVKQGGSHVVEKCIEASEFGIVSVVKEIVETPKAALELAQDQFGNYVIQTALKKSREHRLRDLFESLVKSVEPYYKQLSQSTSGKIVAVIIKQEVGRLKWQQKRRRGLAVDSC